MGLLVLAAFAVSARGGEEVGELDLSGPWSVALDSQDHGFEHRWFARALEGELRLPGCLAENGLGDDVTLHTSWTGDIVDRSYFTDPRYAPYREPGNIKIPFWLQPVKHYVGAAWYQRDVQAPVAWSGQRVVLMLERPHWGTTVWLDEREIGSENSLGTPHEYDLTDGVRTGRTQRLTIRVDNRMLLNVGPNSHSMSDHTQGNWNGIVGTIKLIATPPVWVDDVQVFPNVAAKAVRVRVRIGNRTGRPAAGRLTLAAEVCNTDRPHSAAPRVQSVQIDPKGAALELEYPLGADAQPWDEFSPALYRLTVEFTPDGDRLATPARRAITFGLREIAVAGTQFAINGRKIFLRGTLDCCIYPLTGYPSTDVESWKRVIRICKAHGLNHIRFHSWTPPRAAFIAADELGFYFLVECSSWANQGAQVGTGGPLDGWLIREGERVLRAFGNHPSFTFMAYGNEPAGPDGGKEYLAHWVEHFKKLDPRRKYTCASGWPMLPENEFHVTPAPRIQQWGEGCRSRINALPPATTADYRDFVGKHAIPVISHEIGQWCVYPNFDEIAKYTGVLKPRNFEIFRDFLNANHMGDQAHDFLMASGKLQTLCYKEEIESALRTPGFGGFELLDLHDFPGQGTALVGVLDPFWDSKPYVTPAEYHRFACETVPLARMSKRVLTTAETFAADVEVAHYGPRDLIDAPVSWMIRAVEGRQVAGGMLPIRTIPTGELSALGKIDVPLGSIKAPAKLNLEIAITGTTFANDWDFWVYPAEPAPDPKNDGLRIVHELDDATRAYLEAGGSALLLIPPAQVKTDAVIGFSTVFWNTAWTGGQPPHTLGVLCDPNHPALAEFPTEYHTNWQWWELIHDSAAMNLNGLPAELRPIVQVIDTWFEARRLGLLFEARLGQGRLLVCSVDIESNLDVRPVARQSRQSLLRYVAGAAFAPRHAITAEQVRGLFHSSQSPSTSTQRD
ncbi:MAG: glycoside hydrolase [Planctomycetes bacterium]|nr:glycoside hydrolase [Planctomycetota bacterium]